MHTDTPQAPNHLGQNYIHALRPVAWKGKVYVYCYSQICFEIEARRKILILQTWASIQITKGHKILLKKVHETGLAHLRPSKVKQILVFDLGRVAKVGFPAHPLLHNASINTSNKYKHTQFTAQGAGEASIRNIPVSGRGPGCVYATATAW